MWGSKFERHYAIPAVGYVTGTLCVSFCVMICCFEIAMIRRHVCYFPLSWCEKYGHQTCLYQNKDSSTWKSFQLLHVIFTAALVLRPYGTQRHSQTGTYLQHNSEDGGWIPDNSILITNISQSLTWRGYTPAITDLYL